MLIIKAYINENLIDEVHINNIGGDINGICTYRIIDPPGYDDKIMHNRRQGWRKLASRVMMYMANKDQTKQIQDEYAEIQKKDCEKQALKNLMKGGKK